MRQETLNGARIPYDAPIDELEAKMASKVMKDFTLACEALSYKDDPKAYEIMKFYINDKDKYRRLYVLKTIFRHPQALELTGFLKSAITSEDYLFVEHGLFVIADYGIKVPDDLLFSVIYKNLDRLSSELCALKALDISEENYIRLTELFKKTAGKVLGKDKVVGVTEVSMIGEDFAYFGEKVPAVFVHLGARPKGETVVYPLHNPLVKFDEKCLETACECLVNFALEYLKEEK